MSEEEQNGVSSSSIKQNNQFAQNIDEDLDLKPRTVASIIPSNEKKYPKIHRLGRRLLGFVPALVAQYYSNHSEIKQLPAKQSFKSIVMFADISGFTNLTETLSKLGPEGAELIAFVINRYMELLVKAVSKSGGDIFKFAGDAMIVIWPPSLQEDKAMQELELKNMCQMAIQNALDIQRKLGNTCIYNNLKLSVKIGFGYGDINIIYVGGVRGRSEYLATGDPLVQAFSSEHLASQGGETIVSQQVQMLVKDEFKFTKIPASSDDAPFYQVDNRMTQKVQMKADALKIKNEIDFSVIKDSIMQYIPKALQPYVLINEENWASELRKVTTLFINLGIDLSDAKTDEGLQRIQLVIQTVQNCVYLHEGSLNKLLMDDKGSTLIIVFGLPPLSHQNDAVRGVQTAYLLLDELRKIKCRCFIGISTGTAFCGVVGSSGSRREYSVLGDCINISARLMQMACQPLTPSILVDEQTAQEAQQKIHSIFWGDKKVKGKDKLVPVYEPLAIQEQFRTVRDIRTHYQTKVSKPLKMLNQSITLSENKTFSSSIFDLGRKAMKTIANFIVPNISSPNSRAIIQLQEEGSRSKQRTLTNTNQLQVGVEELSAKVSIFIQTFIADSRQHTFAKNKLLILQGGYGIGKSFLIKNALTKILNIYKYGESLDLMISCLNPISKTLNLNSMRIILKNLFLSLAQRMQKQKSKSFTVFRQPNEQFMQELIGTKLEDDHFNFLCQILLQNSSFLSSLINIDDFIRQEKRQLRNFVLNIFGKYLDQEPIKEEAKENVGTSNTKQEFEKVNMVLNSPLILIIDDMQDTDEISFYLFKKVVKYFKNIMLIGLIRDTDIEISIYHDKSKKIQDEIWRRGLNALLKVKQVEKLCEQLKGLTPKKKISKESILKFNQISVLKELITKYFGFDSFVDPTKVPDDDQVIMTMSIFKHKLSVRSWDNLNEDVVDKYKDCVWFFESKEELLRNDFSRFVLNFIFLKTGGHSLTVINLINNLIEQNYLIINELNMEAVLSLKFKAILEHEEWLDVNVPQTTLQVNGPIIDRLNCHEYLILKFAAVMGDIFDVQSLYRIIPFKDEVNQKRLLQILKELTKQNLIELMDQKQENMYFRFVPRFIRELLYQRMTFAQRRQIHRNVAITLQIIPLPFDLNEKKEYLKLEYHWQQSQARQTIESDNESENHQKLSMQERKSIVIKKVKQALDRNPHSKEVHLKNGLLLKRSEKGVFWSQRYCVIDSENFKIFQMDEGGQTVLQADSIILPLRNLQQIEGVYDTGSFSKQDRHQALIVSSSSWIKRSHLINENRKFYFAIETVEELDEWFTYLEFAKAHAIYQEFVRNFGNISFPITFSDYDQIIKTELIQNDCKPMKISIVESERVQSHRQTRISRQTRVKHKSIQRKSTSNAIELFTSNLVQSNPNLQQKRDQEMLKKVIYEFMVKSQLVFYSQLIQGIDNSLLPESDQIILGEENCFLKENQHLLVKK